MLRKKLPQAVAAMKLYDNGVEISRAAVPVDTNMTNFQDGFG